MKAGILLLLLFSLFLSCSKEPITEWESRYLQDRTFQLLNTTNETFVVGTYYFFDGVVQCYDINGKFQFAGRYYYEANYGPWPRSFHMQLWPLGSRVFEPPDIVGNGDIIILKALDAREDYVLKVL